MPVCFISYTYIYSNVYLRTPLCRLYTVVHDVDEMFETCIFLTQSVMMYKPLKEISLFLYFSATSTGFYVTIHVRAVPILRKRNLSCGDKESATSSYSPPLFKRLRILQFHFVICELCVFRDLVRPFQTDSVLVLNLYS